MLDDTVVGEIQLIRRNVRNNHRFFLLAFFYSERMDRMDTRPPFPFPSYPPSAPPSSLTLETTGLIRPSLKSRSRAAISTDPESLLEASPSSTAIRRHSFRNDWTALVRAVRNGFSRWRRMSRKDRSYAMGGVFGVLLLLLFLWMITLAFLFDGRSVDPPPFKLPLKSISSLSSKNALLYDKEVWKTCFLFLPGPLLLTLLSFSSSSSSSSPPPPFVVIVD